MTELIETVATAFTQGGIWMYLILTAQIVSIAIIIERVVALYLLRKPSQRQLADQFEKDIRRGDLDRVLNKARKVGLRSSLGPVVMSGASAAQSMGGREEIQSKMDEVLLTENNRLEKRTGFLAMLGNVGTLLGLLGTIVGLIQAFGSVSNMDPVAKTNMLTQGISMAMNTTAYGLIMAIPALVMYSVLTNRSQQLAEDLNQGSLKVYNWLIFNLDQVQRGPSKSTTRRRRATS